MTFKSAGHMRRFFISGCQRSGTTMLRLVLESHPGIQCFDEAVGYELMVREARGEEQGAMPTKAGASLLGFKVPRFAEQLTWREFSDPAYGMLPSFYKGEKVIHIVRDVLDVVGSMMKLKAAAGASWLETYGLRILGDIINHPNVDESYKMKYKDIERQGLPLHLVGALYWEIKNQGYFDLKRDEKPVMAVKYERHVLSPEKELRQMCHFLGIEWNDSLLNHPAHSHGELDERGRAIGETDPRRSIDANSVGGYGAVLTEQQAFEVTSLAEDMTRRLACVVEATC